MRPIVTRVTEATLNQFYVFEASLRKYNPNCELHVFSTVPLECSGTVHSLTDESVITKMGELGYDEVICIDPECLVFDDLDELHNATIPGDSLVRVLDKNKVCNSVVVANTTSNHGRIDDLGWYWCQGTIPQSARNHHSCISMRHENTQCGILVCSEYQPWDIHYQSRFSLMFPFELYYEFASIVKDKLDPEFYSNVAHNAHKFVHMVIYMNNLFSKKQKEKARCSLT